MDLAQGVEFGGGVKVTDGSDDKVGLVLLQQGFDDGVADTSVGALRRRERSKVSGTQAQRSRKGRRAR